MMRLPEKIKGPVRRWLVNHFDIATVSISGMHIERCETAILIDENAITLGDDIVRLDITDGSIDLVTRDKDFPVRVNGVIAQ